MAVSMVRAYFFGTGPGTVVPGGLHAFVKTRPELAVPDVEFMFRGAPAAPHLWFPLIRPAYVDGYGIRPTLLHPDSRGEILLRSSSTISSPRRTTCRACAKASSAPATSRIKSQWRPIAAPRPRPEKR
jgi:choline dehydrogenase-like flavoprotein